MEIKYIYVHTRQLCQHPGQVRRSSKHPNLKALEHIYLNHISIFKYDVILWIIHWEFTSYRSSHNLICSYATTACTPFLRSPLYIINSWVLVHTITTFNFMKIETHNILHFFLVNIIKGHYWRPTLYHLTTILLCGCFYLKLNSSFYNKLITLQKWSQICKLLRKISISKYFSAQNNVINFVFLCKEIYIFIG